MAARNSSNEERKAIDLSHHLSTISRNRPVSPLKGLQKYLGNKDVLMLAGGLPSPEYFPFHQLSADVLLPSTFALGDKANPPAPAPAAGSWFWKMLGMDADVKTAHLTVNKYPADRATVNLATALQYGTATGLVPLQKFLREFTEKVYQPAYDDFVNLVQTGNTDGWTRCALTLMNPGDVFLVSEWTYPSAISSAIPYGIRPVAVGMDSQGMSADSLFKVLSEWDENTRGAKRPRVIYTVPVGQNPTGAVMGVTRKQEIYGICVKFDVIIVEDDPYYFQQVGEYVPKGERSTPGPALMKGNEADEYLRSLVPSYVKLDYQGRVIRLDTFSKTVAPGSRLGFFTCNPLFAERLERQGETTTQAPCGFGQSLITSLLLSWQFDGYVRWLAGLSEQYRLRRDHFMDCLAEEFELSETRDHGVGAWAGCRVLVAREKIVASAEAGDVMREKRVFGRKQYFSLVPPAAGMFVWLKLHLDAHPAVVAGLAEEETLEMQLWVQLAEAGVLFAPGWFFAAERAAADGGDEAGHFRISFSSAEFDDMRKAVRIFRRVLAGFYAIEG